MMLIVIDGPDFAGKSTIIQNLAKSLSERGYDVRTSRTSVCGIFSNIVELAQSERTHSLIKSLIFHAAYLIDVFTGPRSWIHIQETYWPRVFAYDIVHRRPLGYAFFTAFRRAFIKPDLSIFIEANFTTRYRRYRS